MPRRAAARDDSSRSRGFLPLTYQRWGYFQNNLAEETNHNYSSEPQKQKILSQLGDPDVKEGEVIDGFSVQQVADIPEFRMRAVRLLHDDTGAQYLHLQRDDDNNAFSINLRTTPFDSTGVPHILEHTTLCGSNKYPCREPFFKMLDRSLATYMNAMTGTDYTMYPFSTQNQKDYYNLMDVYMDAVFNPRLRETDFRQEGWRLEHEVVDDPNSPIVFKGVVFNEMKGELSENQKIYSDGVLNNLMPSHTYKVNYGGDPLQMPLLTYEQLKHFHSQFYHPSNARFYSYGNFPLRDHLKFINDSYLKQYGKVTQRISELTKVPPETRWTTEKKEHIFGRVDNMAPDPTKQSTLSVSYLCSDIKDTDETFTLQVLSDLLTSGANSAFYKSLVEPNIGSGFCDATGFEGHTRDTYFTVGLQGLATDKFDWVIDTCNKTIDKVIQEGFNPTQIEAILHNIELSTKHQAVDFGLKFLHVINPIWNHDGDVIKALKMNDIVMRFKENLSSNPRYLQEKVEHYFKRNGHRLVLAMTPDPKYEEKNVQRENELLQSKLSSLTPDMKNKIYRDGLNLKEEQDSKQDVDCLPSLKSSDLKKDIDADELKFGKVLGVPIQFNLQPTNGVTYLKGVIDTSHIPWHMRPYIPLFANVATKMSTKRHTFRELDQLIDLKTGGLDISNQVSEKKDDSNSFESGLLFSSYSLNSNVSNMFSLWEEIFNDVTFTDVKRLETLMKAISNKLISSLSDKGHLYVMSASAALVNPASRRNEENGGLTYIRWLSHMVQQNKYQEVLEKLGVLAKHILSKDFMRLSVNVTPEAYTSTGKCISSFVSRIQGSFQKSFVQNRHDNIEHLKQKLGVQFEAPFPVSFTSRSVPTVPYTHSDFAPLRVLCRLLSSKYLLPEIREKVGAYGAGANISPAGVVSFFSYRDPRPAQSFSIFDNSVDWIDKGAFSDQDVEGAKLGTFQAMDAPIPPGVRGSRHFLFGITDDDFRKQRQILMDVTRDDVVRVATKYLDPSTTPREGKILLGPLNSEIEKRPGERWTIDRL